MWLPLLALGSTSVLVSQTLGSASSITWGCSPALSGSQEESPPQQGQSQQLSGKSSMEAGLPQAEGLHHRTVELGAAQ